MDSEAIKEPIIPTSGEKILDSLQVKSSLSKSSKKHSRHGELSSLKSKEKN